MFIGLDIGPCGKLLKPLGPLDFEEAVSGFAEVVRIGAACGVDCIFLETMNDGAETRAALLAAKENCDLPVLVSNAYGADGKLMTGGSPESVVAMLEGLGADAVGVNCSLGPDALAPIVERYLAAASVPVLMKPNAGLPAGKRRENFLQCAAGRVLRADRRAGAEGPADHGRLLRNDAGLYRCTEGSERDLVPPPAEEKAYTVIASRGTVIELGKAPVIIGERINPTGKKRLRKALEEGDMAYVLNEGHHPGGARRGSAGCERGHAGRG